MDVETAERFNVRVFTFGHDYGVVGQARSRIGAILVGRQFAKDKLTPGVRVDWQMQIDDPGTPHHGRRTDGGEFINR